MGLQNFTNLKELTKSLMGEELNLAKKHLVAFESYHTNTPSQMLRLFKLLLKNKDVKYEEAKNNISKSSSDKSFNQLIKRTLDRVLESLILDINILRGDNYSPVFQNRFKIRKLIMQASILQGRGLSGFSLKNFDWIIRTSKKYELYDELIETLYLKQAVVFNKDGKKAYEKIAKEITLYESCRDCLRDAKDLYRSFYAEASFQANTEKVADSLQEKVLLLEIRNRSLKSANVMLYLYPLKMEIASLSKDYDKGLKIGLEFIELMKSDPAIYSKIRIGIYYTNLADNEISACRFKNGIKFSKLALEFLQDRLTVNNVIAYDFYIVSNFLNGNYDEALRLIDEALKMEIVDKYKLYKTKFFYYKAMVYFIKREFKSTFLLLNNLNEIEKDKEGWNVWIRIMRILCSIELLKLNLIDYDLESFRKYIQRIDKKFNVNARDKIILKILLELDKENYNFNSVAVNLQNEINNLDLKTGNHPWKSNSPELIVFDLWFNSKYNNRHYIADYEFHIERLIQPKDNRIKKKSVNSDKNFTQLYFEF